MDFNLNRFLWMFIARTPAKGEQGELSKKWPFLDGWKVFVWKGRLERMVELFLKWVDWKNATISMVWLVLFWKNILSRKINSIDKYLESTYIVVVFNESILSNPYVVTFLKKILLVFFPLDILRIKSRDPLAQTFTYFFPSLYLDVAIPHI